MHARVGKLSADAPHVLADDRRVTRRIPSPNPLVEQRAVVDAPWILAQKGNEVELDAREIEHGTGRGHHDGPLAIVYGHLGKDADAPRTLPAQALVARKVGAHAAAQDLERERLEYIIVCSGGESVELVDILDAQRVA